MIVYNKDELKKDLTYLYNLVNENIKVLVYKVKIKNKILLLYGAGKKFFGGHDYYRIFPRDSFTASFLMKDYHFLRNILTFCFWCQGKNYNPFTGEEPGKIPHEWPGVNLRGKNTLFAAADTTLLFLIGIGIYYEWVKEKKFIKENSSYIYNALEYVKRHLKDNLFWDSPSYCHSNSFALYSTCWRDIGYPERKNRKHLWPASYLMVNILLVKALRILARLSELDILFLDKQYLKKQAEKTRRKILKEFWISKEGYFASAIDMKGKIKTLYLDSLWSLYFLEKNDIEKSKIKKVFKNLKKLETPYGYITRENKLGYEYKGGIKKIECTIWPWENAYLAIVAERFGFYNIKEKCFFPVRALKISKYPFTEYLQYKKSKIPLPKGCNVQLWTIAYVKAMYEMITTKK